MTMIGCSLNTRVTRLVTWQTLVSGGGIVSHPAPLDTAALLDVEFWVGADGAVLRSRWLTVFAGWITFNCKTRKYSILYDISGLEIIKVEFILKL